MGVFTAQSLGTNTVSPCYPPTWFVPNSRHGNVNKVPVWWRFWWLLARWFAHWFSGRHWRPSWKARMQRGRKFPNMEQLTVSGKGAPRSYSTIFNLFFGEQFNWLHMLHMLWNFFWEDLQWELWLWSCWISWKRPRWSCLQVTRRTAEVVVISDIFHQKCARLQWFVFDLVGGGFSFAKSQPSKNKEALP